MRVQSLGGEDLLEEGMATYSSILAWVSESDTTEVTSTQTHRHTHTHTHTHTQICVCVYDNSKISQTEPIVLPVPCHTFNIIVFILLLPLHIFIQHNHLTMPINIFPTFPLSLSCLLFKPFFFCK